MTATGRAKLYRAVDAAILGVLRKYHLTDAEVVGILMLLVAQFQKHHLLRGRNENKDEDGGGEIDEA